MPGKKIAERRSGLRPFEKALPERHSGTTISMIKELVVTGFNALSPNSRGETENNYERRLIASV
jgi:hypothetical protein